MSATPLQVERGGEATASAGVPPSILRRRRRRPYSLKSLPALEPRKLEELLEGRGRFEIPECRRRRRSLTLGPAVSVVSWLVSLWVMAGDVGVLRAFCMLSILAVHEAGHWVMTGWLELPATPPVFVGTCGAFIGLLKPPRDPGEEAWIGISGPLAGMVATVFVHVLGWATDSPELLRSALWGHVIHLVNMVPAGHLDGGHVAALVGRWLWIPGAAVVLSAPFLFDHLPVRSVVLLALVGLVAVARAVKLVLHWLGLKPDPPVPIRAREWRVMVCLALLVVVVAGCGCVLAGLQVSDMLR